jgi:hypothetical protein
VRIQKRRIGGRVGGSLNQSFAKTGESVILLYRLLRIFGADINWSTDVRSGDTFKLITEKRYLEGKLLGYGRILAAEYRGESRPRARFLLQRRDGSGGYYSSRRPFAQARAAQDAAQLSTHFVALQSAALSPDSSPRQSPSRRRLRGTCRNTDLGSR